MMKRFSVIFLLLFIPIISGCGGGSTPGNADTAAPGTTVKLIFIHHSTGQKLARNPVKCLVSSVERDLKKGIYRKFES